MKLKTIRGSEVQDFLRCRQRWQWSWVDGLETEKKNSKLVFGDTIHKFLQIWYCNGSPQDAAYMAEKFFNQQVPSGAMDEVERQEIWDTFKQVANGYVRQYRDDFNKYRVLATEFKFAIPMGGGIYYEGTIDLVLEEIETGHVWFSDHKSTSSIEKYDKNVDLDRQTSRYWWALNQLMNGRGYVGFVENPMDEVTDWVQVRKSDMWKDFKGKQVYGCFYNIILRDYPVPPKELQKNKLSTDKRQKTTFELYAKALVEKGYGAWVDDPFGHGKILELHDESYKEFLDFLKDNPKEFFRRTRILRNDTELQAAMDEFMLMLKDMRAKKKHIYRNITTDCSWDCKHFELCKASLDGSNVEFLKESLYKTKEVV